MRLRHAGIAAALALAAACSSGAGSSSMSGSGLASGSIGDLRISGGYIPAEASPDVAAAYFTVRNTGTQPDMLISASTPMAASAEFHDEATLPSGADIMTSLGPVTVPAKGEVAFSVGHKHLMLMQPTHRLTKGEQVPITLHFKKAGSVTLSFPVTAATGPDDMKGMPGMSG